MQRESTEAPHYALHHTNISSQNDNQSATRHTAPACRTVLRSQKVYTGGIQNRRTDLRVHEGLPERNEQIFQTYVLCLYKFCMFPDCKAEEAKVPGDDKPEADIEENEEVSEDQGHIREAKDHKEGFPSAKKYQLNVSKGDLRT